MEGEEREDDEGEGEEEAGEGEGGLRAGGRGKIRKGRALQQAPREEAMKVQLC